MSYFIYVLRCSDNSLYCGITNNLEKRLQDHNKGLSKSAKYTRAKRPVKLVYSEKYDTKSAALKREYEIKQMPKDKKEALIAQP